MTMKILHPLFALALVGFAASRGLAAEPSANLLRNGAFQDDWLTKLTEVKNHHYCFSSEHYNRRDFNPDSWDCRGNWQWIDADGPDDARRFVLRGPKSTATQRVNWVLVHDEKRLHGFADAGRFPSIVPVRSRTPLSLVRDLTLRARVRGRDALAGAGSITVALCPPGKSTFLPFGSITKPTVVASADLPGGTYDWQWIEVQLPAAKWLEAAAKVAASEPKTKAEFDAAGPTLPGAASVSLSYAGATGEVEIERVELTAPRPAGPNLLANGGFEEAGADGYPAGWGQPQKYTYFPPGNYYLFNTWQNTTYPNRGPVAGDTLVAASGRRSLKMIVAAGDEKSVASAPIILNQKEPRLIEVRARVKTDRLCMLQIDAVDETGKRLEGHLSIHKAQASVGTEDWRLVRQVFRPRQPVKSIRLKLCARGVNGFTMEDTSEQPQNNVVGAIWWDDVAVFEPETPAAELAARGVKAAAKQTPEPGLRLEGLSLGERMLGDNVLRATLVNPGRTVRAGLRWEFTSPSGRRSTFAWLVQRVPKSGRLDIALPYSLAEPCPTAYTEYRGSLTLVGAGGKPLASTPTWFGAWTTPIDLELGNLYLRPEQKLYVRLNVGLSRAAMAKAATARLEVVRRGTGKVLKSFELPATPTAILAQRAKVPKELRDDLTNLLLTDLDVSFLPVQPFNRPERNWFLRATVVDAAGAALATADSPPFCRLAHDAKQPPVGKVTIDTDNLLYVNDKPWMPWGAVYGHQPVYDGPADPGEGNYHDIRNLRNWNIYDRFTSATSNRSQNDFSCLRYVAGRFTPRDKLEKSWAEENLYASTAFPIGHVVYSVKDLLPAKGSKRSLDAKQMAEYLAFCRTAPMVVSMAAGIEEAFGLFHAATPEQLAGLEKVVDYLRQKTGKPVMVGHGGYWNRQEWEKAPFFDIYDPETEPFYPANLHVDLQPLIRGQAKTSWLRPQMYEDVPYQRWRFHVYVELMRGCRGWQMAHGPGDPSLFRGLHAEMEFCKPIAYSKDRGPKVAVEPWIENWSRRYNGKTYLIAATTHGMTIGRWRWTDERVPKIGRVRVTDQQCEFRTAANNYGVDALADRGPRVLGIEYLPDSRSWPAGTKIVQWVRLDPKASPSGLLALVKADGRWTHTGSWGKVDAAKLRNDPALLRWFLSCFYRKAQGFAFKGWYGEPRPSAGQYVPNQATDLGLSPAAGQWVRLEIPLDAVGATGKLIDGVAFLHEGGSVSWGRTTIVGPDGAEQVMWGNQIGPDPEKLAEVKISVAGLPTGAAVRVLFEDRNIVAEDGFFTDDFRGRDLYQRFGGGPNAGYGNTPVALHFYEIPTP